MERLDYTGNGIRFEDDLISCEGCNFHLYPFFGQHDAGDVKEAKRWIRNNRDAISIIVHWKYGKEKERVNTIKSNIIRPSIETNKKDGREVKGEIEYYI